MVWILRAHQAGSSKRALSDVPSSGVLRYSRGQAMRQSLRVITAVAAGALAVPLLAGCVQSSGTQSASGSAKKDLTVFISDDTNIETLWQSTLIPAFEKQYPSYSIKIDFDLHGEHDEQTVAKLTAATVQKRDPGFDLVDAGFVSQLSQSGLLAKATEKQIPNLANVPEAVLKVGGANAIPYRASSVLLAYNSANVASPPKTLSDLLAWIKANPGKFTYNSPASGGSGGAFVTTVLDKTIPASVREKMVTGYDPTLQSYWSTGFATLHSLNPYMYQQGVYPNGNNQVLDLLASGQIDMAPVWSDQFITGVKNGQIPSTIKTTQISDPSLTGSASYLGIPKASPRAAEAYTLANWLLSPKAQELIVSSIAGYPVVNLSELSESVQKEFANADIGNLRPPYFSQMTTDMNDQWAQKVPGN